MEKVGAMLERASGYFGSTAVRGSEMDQQTGGVVAFFGSTVIGHPVVLALEPGTWEAHYETLLRVGCLGGSVSVVVPCSCHWDWDTSGWCYEIARPCVASLHSQ